MCACARARARARIRGQPHQTHVVLLVHCVRLLVEVLELLEVFPLCDQRGKRRWVPWVVRVCLTGGNVSPSEDMELTTVTCARRDAAHSRVHGTERETSTAVQCSVHACASISTTCAI